MEKKVEIYGLQSQNVMAEKDRRIHLVNILILVLNDWIL